uniref:Xrn1 helical domain-containing protein n=2 Tax=Gossypium raimondii TaxID=29730 RepID=A0A0D2VKC5_GOSRA|nr:hypothetical protein B456_013G257600 [Gossypium raimondii]
MDVTKNSLADINDILRNTKELKEKLKENLRNKSDFLKNGATRDQVRLGVAGWKKRYYSLKFSAETDWDIEITRKEIVQKSSMGAFVLFLGCTIVGLVSYLHFPF